MSKISTHFGGVTPNLKHQQRKPKTAIWGGEKFPKMLFGGEQFPKMPSAEKGWSRINAMQ